MATPIWKADNEGCYACVKIEDKSEISVFSAQIFYEPKTALKNTYFLK